MLRADSCLCAQGSVLVVLQGPNRCRGLKWVDYKSLKPWTGSPATLAVSLNMEQGNLVDCSSQLKANRLHIP